MENQTQREFFGIIVSKEIMENRELSIAEKFIYSYIASFKNSCYENNERIAERLGLSESVVAHALPKLAQKGFLVITKKGKSTSRRIFETYSNKKRARYFAKKEASKVGKNPVENSKKRVQNMHSRVQNMHSQKTGGVSAKYADIEYRINKNKEKNEQKPNLKLGTSAGLAGELPASRLIVKRNDYESANEFERAFYQRNTIYLGAN